MKTLSKAMMEALRYLAEHPRHRRPPKAPKPLRAVPDGEMIGKIVRAQAPGQGAKMGVVTGESHEGKCWVIKTPRGVEVYNKCYVQAISSKMAGKKVRALKAMLGLGTKGKIYGSGDLD